MNTTLNPNVLAKLEAFGNRRRRLILYRGLCAGLATLIVSMTLVAVVDWLFFLSDVTRWMVSAAAYSLVAIVVWYTSIRQLWRMPDASKMARLIESAEPGLREELLSAVELSDPKSEKSWDSPAFRRFIQQNVAHKMGGVDVQSLLPWKLIQRWVSAASVASVVLAVLLCLPGLNFTQRFARAIVPMASLERVSTTSITILNPSPANTTVASGEQVEVTVRIDGPTHEDQVLLETMRDGETSRIEMSRSTGGERTYTSTIRVARESLQYRIWANDARSQKYMIQSRERPAVTAFTKTYQYPEYLQRPSKTVAEQTGDIAAVMGTVAQLIIDVNQPVTLAHLLISTSTGEQTLPMTPEINSEGELIGRMRAAVPVSASGTYRVHLVAAETGLENKFSPEYMIRAEPDIAPTIRIEQPSPAILVPSDEIVTLVGQAEDDWALQRVEQHFKIGDQPWEIATIAESETGAQSISIEHPWDLFPHELQPGSIIFTKLVAVDRNGSKGESRPIRAVISSHEFDPQRLHGLAAARAAHNKLLELVNSSMELRESVDSIDDDQGAVAALALAEQHDQVAGEAMAAITSAIGRAQPGRESMDLVLVGQAISQASMVGVGFVRNHLASSDTEEARKASRFVEKQITDAAGAFDHLLRLSEFALIGNDLQAIRKMQEDAWARVNHGPERIARRMIAMGSQADVVARFAESMRHHSDGEIDTEIASIIEDLDAIKSLGDVFAGPIEPRSVQEAGDRLAQVQQRTMAVFESQLIESVDPRRRLVSAAGTNETIARRAARFSRQLHDMKQSLGEQAARGELDRLEEDAVQTRRTRDMATAAMDAATAGLMATARLEQKRKDSDSKFVADTSRAWRAIETIRVRTKEGGAEETRAVDDFDRLSDAISLINIVHQVDDLSALVKGISRLERPSAQQSASIPLVGLQSSDWFSAESNYASLGLRLDKASVNAEVKELLEQSRQSDAYRSVRSEMVLRPRPDREPEDCSDSMTKLISDLSRLRAMLGEQLIAARKELQQLAPRLDQMLAELARQVREEEAETRELATAAEAGEDVEEELDQQQQAADEVADRLGELRESIREDAAEQDVMTEEGRERMRDADDALAMLQEPPEDIERALNEAADAEDPAAQQEALVEAARQQAMLAERLEQLSEHFENLEQGDADATRGQLREAEEELGIRDQVEAQQQQLEQLADLAELPPTEALAALEAELAENREMQRALDDVTREQLEDAQSNLANAAAQQNQQASEVQQQLTEQQARAREADTNEMIEELQQLGQQAADLAQQQVAQVAEEIEESEPIPPNPFDRDRDLNEEAAEEVQAIGEQLANAGDEAQSAANPDVSAEDLAQAAEDLAEALQEAARNIQQASSPGQTPQEGAANDPEQSNSQAERLADQAADRMRDLAQRAEQLADRAGRSEPGQQPAPAEDDPSDVWGDAEEESVAERGQPPAEEIDDPSDVWGAPEQDEIADALQEAQQMLEGAARNQERLGNENNAQELGQIAQQTDEAIDTLNDFTDQAMADEGAALSQSDVLDQLAQAQQEIQQPADQLEQFLGGDEDTPSNEQSAAASELGSNDPFGAEVAPSPLEEPGSEPGASEPGSEPSGSEPGSSESGSEPGAEPGQSGSEPSSSSGEPGGSERGSSESGSEPGSEPGQSGSEPSSSSGEPGGSEPGSSESGSEPGSEPGQSGSEPSSSSGEPGGSERGSSESGSEPGSEPGQSGSEPSSSSGEPSGSEPGSSESGSEPSGSESGQNGAPSSSSEPRSSQPSGQGSPSANGPAAGQSGSEPAFSDSAPLTQPAARQLAEALNELDQQLFGESSSGQSSNSAPSISPSQASGSQGPSSSPSQAPANPASVNADPSQAAGQPGAEPAAANRVAEAIAAAAQAQAREFAQNRAEPSNPSGNPGSAAPPVPSGNPIGQGYAAISEGSGVQGGPVGHAPLPVIGELKRDDWAKLPSKLANDLLDGSREKVAPEYRQAVETYFRLLAEQAREDQ